ncbi:putative sugar kinase YihV [Auxenochlorella protothecoides]|uniref:Putative sugar kinase YihV n=1 Tax=Auxenochlorella protothecoides TaxID=3075 RepID=A0A087STQ5_AUXPR|nr:putative sugar kinase YihV [Auxenochlorella protothecoides]KFM29109.1 putative sugar kinase YihV [Auxenochlorella protothecoides]
MKEPRPAQLDCAVLGLGSCGLDTLALVDSFPAPDEKIRARRLLIQGGGNCANALTAAARLGAPVAIISKAGSDAAGSSIEAELQGEGIDTQCLLFSKTGPSPTTYIIVDAAGIPVLVEAEKPRPGLDVLLQGAQYVYTNATFPKTWTQELSLGSALLCMLGRLTSARWLVTTLGPSGLVAFQRQEGSGEPIGSGADLDRLMQKLWGEADARRKGIEGSEEAACTALNGSLVRVGACASGHLQLQDGTGFGVLVHQAASLETVVDTTGAGDAFLGSLLVSVSVGASLEAAAKLGTVVAAAKCTELGARTGMPHLAQLHPSLQGVLESRRAA